MRIEIISSKSKSRFILRYYKIDCTLRRNGDMTTLNNCMADTANVFENNNVNLVQGISGFSHLYKPMLHLWTTACLGEYCTPVSKCWYLQGISGFSHLSELFIQPDRVQACLFAQNVYTCPIKITVTFGARSEDFINSQFDFYHV